MRDEKQELLATLPAVTDLLKSQTAAGWLLRQPQSLVTACLRRALKLRSEHGCGYWASSMDLDVPLISKVKLLILAVPWVLSSTSVPTSMRVSHMSVVKPDL